MVVVGRVDVVFAFHPSTTICCAQEVHIIEAAAASSKDIWLTLLGGTRILLRGIRVGSTEPIRFIVIPFRCSTPGFNG
eukprot:scaffold22774_cov55-Attheya_sp.AAC.8